MSNLESSSLFQLLALSLANAALMALGYIEDPDAPHDSVDTNQAPFQKMIHLEAAKQNIELLEMLDVKTRGNLTEDEKQVLHGLLFDLRMKYVDASKHA